MKITLESADLTLEHVTELGKWLRARFEGTDTHVDMWIEAPEEFADDAIAALEAVFGGDPHISWISRPQPEDGDRK